MDDGELEDLERELPALSRLNRFARGLDSIPWFANLGEPLTPGARAVAARFTEGLGFPEADVAVLTDWEEAADAASHNDWNSPAWEAEELLRADLTGRALSLMSEEALKISMTMIAEKVAEPAKVAMEQAGFIWDVEDEPSKELAVGSAVQAAHLAGLVLVAAHDHDFDADDHPFTLKFQLFEFGRWPVAVAGRSFNVF